MILGNLTGIVRGKSQPLMTGSADDDEYFSAYQ